MPRLKAEGHGVTSVSWPLGPLYSACQPSRCWGPTVATGPALSWGLVLTRGASQTPGALEQLRSPLWLVLTQGSSKRLPRALRTGHGERSFAGGSGQSFASASDRASGGTADAGAGSRAQGQGQPEGLGTTPPVATPYPHNSWDMSRSARPTGHAPRDRGRPPGRACPAGRRQACRARRPLGLRVAAPLSVVRKTPERRGVSRGGSLASKPSCMPLESGSRLATPWPLPPLCVATAGVSVGQALGPASPGLDASCRLPWSHAPGHGSAQRWVSLRS